MFALLKDHPQILVHVQSYRQPAQKHRYFCAQLPSQKRKKHSSNGRPTTTPPLTTDGWSPGDCKLNNDGISERTEAVNQETIKHIQLLLPPDPPLLLHSINVQHSRCPSFPHHIVEKSLFAIWKRENFHATI